MSAERIRQQYNVPAKRGMRITVDGIPGVIVGFDRESLRLRVRLQGIKGIQSAHPTWRVEYPEAS